MLTFSMHWSIDHLPEEMAQSSLHLKWFLFDSWHWREDRAGFNSFREWLQLHSGFKPFCTQPGNLLSARVFKFQNTILEEREIKSVWKEYLLTWKAEAYFRMPLSFSSVTLKKWMWQVCCWGNFHISAVKKGIIKIWTGNIRVEYL